MQYTKEPWEIRGQDIYDVDGIYIATWSGTIKNAHRIIECVNGCAGIINPSAVREVVEAAKLADGIAGTLMDELVGNKATDWGIVNNGLVKIHKALEALNKGG